MTVKEICEKIWEIEKDLDLFDQKINGVYFWKLIRVRIFNTITSQKSNFGQAHTSLKQTFIERLKILPRMMYYTYTNGVYSRKSSKDILVFDNNRYFIQNGEKRSIYTFNLEQKFKEENKSFEIVYKSHLNKHLFKADKDRSYIEHAYINYVINRIFKNFNFNRSEIKLIRNLNEKLRQKFNISINLDNIINEKVNFFILEKKFYITLLQKRQVKTVFLVCSYGFEALISACKEKGVLTTEVQHGTIDKYHLGYSYPNNKNIPYFPDKMQLFGRYWFDNTFLPLERDNISFSGYPYFEAQLKNYSNFQKKDKTITFISQGTIGAELSKAAFCFARDNLNYKVYYKLHPGEYDRWKNVYPVLKNAILLENFQLISDNNFNLYELIMKSEFVSGVYSTAIFESLAIGCKVILMNLPGIEYMEYLIKNGFVKLANNHKELSECIKENNFEKIDRDYFFKR